MTSIDERVVNMVFNNDKFEAAIKTSIKSLETLKSKLKFDEAAGSFKKIEKASQDFSLNSMGQQIESLSNRFSALGTVGTTIMQNITNAAINAGKNLYNSTFGQIISGGKTRALNLEQAQFQIEGLGADWNAVLEDVNYGVQDTAYGLDAAAKAASQLLASNVQLGDEMKASLRGISGVAAMTSSEYEDISRIFTTVAGNGKLMTEQLNQMSSRGLNAAATLANALGVTEAEVREMVTQGKIDFKTFATIMDDTFGEHAKKANETFTGSLSNMKAALSRVGAEIATPAYQHLRDIINKITPVINSVKTALVPIYDTIKKAMEEGKNFIVNFLDPLTNVDGKNVGKDNLLTSILQKPMEQLSVLLTKTGQVIVNFATAVIKVISPIGRAFNDAFGDSIFNIIDRALDLFIDLTNRLIISEEFGNNLYRLFHNIFTIINLLLEAFTTLVGFVGGNLAKVFISVFGFVIDILVDVALFVTDCIVIVKDFIEELFQLETVKLLIGAIATIFNTLKNIIISIATGFRNLVKAIDTKTFGALTNLLSIIVNILLTVVQSIDTVIMKIVELVEAFLNLPIVQEIISTLVTIFSNLQDKIIKVAVAVRDKFVNGFIAAKNKISDFIKVIRELVGKYVELPSAQQVVMMMQEGIRNLFDQSKSIFEKIVEVIANIVEKVKELSATSLENVIENFEKLRSKIASILDFSTKIEKLKGIFNIIQNGFSTFSKETSQAIDSAKGGLASFIDFVKDRFEGIDLGKVIAAGFGVSLIKFFWQLGNALESGGKLLNSIEGFMNSFKDIGDNIAGTLKDFRKKIKAEADAVKFKSIAMIVLSLAALAGALAALSMMDPDRVRESALILAALSVGIIALSTAMVTLQSKVSAAKMAQAGNNLLKITASLFVIIIALKMLSEMPIDGISERLGILAVLMVELTLFMLAVSKIDKKGEAQKVSISVMAMSTSLMLLTKALAKMGSLDFKSVIGAGVLLTALITSLKALSRMSSEALYSAGAIIAISVSLLLMVTALKKLSKIPSNELVRGLQNLLPVIAAIGLLFLTTQAAGKHAVKAGGSLILISASLVIMSVAIKRLAEIDQSTLDRAGNVVARIIVVFAAFTAMTKFAGKNAIKAGIAITMISASLILLAGAMTILAQIEPEDLKRVTNSITVLMAMIALIVASTGKVREAKKTMTMIAVSIGILAASLAILSMIEPKNLIAASASLSILMASLALLSKFSKEIKKAKTTIILLAGIVAGLALLINLMAKENPDEALKFATSISEILLAMSVALGILGKLNVKVALAAEAAAALGVFVSILSAIIIALSAICGAINQAADGALLDAMNHGIPILEAVGNALGSFVGGIISGVLGSSSKALPTIGQSLSDFMTNLQGFINGAKSIDDSAIRAIESVGSLFLTLAGTGFIEALPGVNVGNTLKDMSSNIIIFGEALKDFSATLDGVNLDDLNKGADAAKKISEVTANLSEGGLVGGIFGSKSEGMKSFAENIEGFGQGLKKYGDSVADLNSDAINNSIEPASSLIQLVSNIQKEAPGGDFIDICTAIFGSSSAGMKALSENLPEFGNALTKYSNSVENVNAEKIEESAKAGEALVKMINMIDKEAPSGDFIDICTAIFGSRSSGMKAFSDNLAEFGKALWLYGINVSRLNVSAVQDSAKAAEAIVKVFKMLDEEGGVKNWFTGSEDVAAKGFIANISGLGKALSDFSDNVKDIQSEGLSLAIQTAESLASIYATLHDKTSDDFWGTFQTDASFANNIKNLGSALKSFADNVSGISGGSGDIDKAISAARGLAAVYDALNPTTTEAFGLWTSETGNGKSFKALADNAGALGEGLSTFATSTNGITTDGCDSALALANNLVEIYNALDPSGGAGEFWFGSKSESFSALSANLMNLANAIKGFVDNTQEISLADFSLSRNILNFFKDLSVEIDPQRMANIGTSIEALGSNLQQFGYKTADFDGDKFSTVIEKLGDLKTKVEEISEIDTTKLDAVVESLGKFAESGIKAVKEGLSSEDKVQEIVNNTKDMVSRLADEINAATDDNAEKFKEAGKEILTSIGEGISEASESLTLPAVNELLNSIIATMTIYQSQVKTAGQELGNQIGEGIKSSNSQVNKMVDFILNKALSQIALFNDKFKSAGTASFKKFADGIRDSSVSSAISSAIYSTVSNATANLNVYQQFYKVGTDCARGLAAGLRSQESQALVRSAGGQLSYTAYLSAKSSVKSNSPAKKFIELGKFCVDGLAIGLSRTSDAVKSSELLGTSVYNASKTALDKVYSLLSDDIDLNPTITPHFDLTEVKSGYNEMTSMLDSSRVGLNARIVGADVQRSYSNQPQVVTYKTENNYMLDTLNANLTQGNIENLGQEVWAVLTKYLNLSRI